MNDLFKISVPGHSGCQVDVVGSSLNPRIRKTSLVTNYISRLHAQRLKQQDFFYFFCPGIKIPKVIKHGKDWYEMEFIPFLDAISFFERTDPEVIKLRINVLINLIKTLIQESKKDDLDINLLKLKIAQIKDSCLESIWNHYYKEYESILYKQLHSSMKISLGKCHGDLTLSNILFSTEENEICLIDFLDSFIESPLIDIIKLRQDTKFHWTSTLYPRKHDITKIKIINSWVNDMLNGFFKKNIETEEFLILEMINYLRLIPYAKNENDHHFVQFALSSIVKEIFL